MFLILQAILILVVVAEGALKRCVLCFECGLVLFRPPTIDLNRSPKRLMLRIIFFMLGIIVTTAEFERRDCKAKVGYGFAPSPQLPCFTVAIRVCRLQILVGNKLSFVDYIAIHLAIDCYTVR